MSEAIANFGSRLRWWRNRRGFSQLDLSIHFRRHETSLRMFTTIATLGTPQNVTLQEVRIECFFPADDATAQRFRQWAATAA